MTAHMMPIHETSLSIDKIETMNAIIVKSLYTLKRYSESDFMKFDRTNQQQPHSLGNSSLMLIQSAIFAHKTTR